MPLDAPEPLEELGPVRMIAVGLIMERLEDVAQRAPLTLAEWGEVAAALLPEVYARRPLGEPTAAAPGSAEKLETMGRRFGGGQEVFHPRDERLSPRD